MKKLFVVLILSLSASAFAGGLDCYLSSLLGGGRVSHVTLKEDATNFFAEEVKIEDTKYYFKGTWHQRDDYMDISLATSEGIPIFLGSTVGFDRDGLFELGVLSADDAFTIICEKF